MRNYGRMKVSSYFFVVLVNLLALFWFKQKADPADSSQQVSLIPERILLAQKCLGGVILTHAILILIFDSYKYSSFIKEVFQKSGFFASLSFITSECLELFYYSLYVALAILGLYHTAWYTFHLNDILMINSVLKNILRSVWRPRTSIVLTLILFIVIMYAFSAIGFVFFESQYAKSMPNHIPCKNIYECFILTLDKGFKFDGGIGNYLSTNNEMKQADSGEYVPIDIGRFIFENLLLIVALIIILNILSGIIIDTFGSLREEYNKYLKDTETYCFVCGFDRETIDKESEEADGMSKFDFHVKKEHYQWNYLFYMAYLRDKEVTEYTGIESYVAEKVLNEDISWFPNHRAMIIKQEDAVNAPSAIDDGIHSILKDVPRCYSAAGDQPAVRQSQGDAQCESSQSRREREEGQDDRSYCATA